MLINVKPFILSDGRCRIEAGYWLESGGIQDVTITFRDLMELRLDHWDVVPPDYPAAATVIDGALLRSATSWPLKFDAQGTWVLVEDDAARLTIRAAAARIDRAT